MNTLRGLIARLLPFTPKGWVFLFLAAALLAVGVLHSELATLLWGTGFGVLIVYTALGASAFRLVLARRFAAESAGISAWIVPARVRRGEHAAVKLRAPFPRRRLPAIRLYVAAHLEWNGRRAGKEGVVPAGADAPEVDCTTQRRGRYRLERLEAVAADLFGFCRAPVPMPASGTLTVVPDPVDARVTLRASGAGGEQRIHTVTRHRSDELFETRRYVPGDDPRRINWKLFAHWNEMLVRIGEEVPPPRSRLMCYLYTGPAPPGVRGPAVKGARAPAAERRLDEAVSVYAGVCRSLVRQGAAVTYGFGGTASRGTISAGGVDELLTDLAGADWDEGRLPGGEQFSRRLPMVLVLPARTPGVEELLAAVQRYTRVVETIVAEADAGDAGEPRPLWRRLLLTGGPDEAQATETAVVAPETPKTPERHR
ncbi:MAG: DUF58 domain-containing protein [Spirochaetaceae bacterium]